MDKSCVVIFPLYKLPDPLEMTFLENGFKLLKEFDAVIVAPNNLEITDEFGFLKNLKIIRFKDYYFKCISGYNELLLSENFYTCFINYKYMLIHQADVYLFKDELSYWCNQNYDYIGSPWLRREDSTFKKLFNKFRKFYNPHYGKKHNKVGNGGFSLRKTSTAIEVLSKTPKKLLRKYIQEKHHNMNEDVFWSLEAPIICQTFSIPPLLEALHFGVEFNPELALKLLDNELPFGCHAPQVHGENIWKKYIPILNS